MAPATARKKILRFLRVPRGEEIHLYGCVDNRNECCASGNRYFRKSFGALSGLMLMVVCLARSDLKAERPV